MKDAMLLNRYSKLQEIGRNCVCYVPFNDSVIQPLIFNAGTHRSILLFHEEEPCPSWRQWVIDDVDCQRLETNTYPQPFVWKQTRNRSALDAVKCLGGDRCHSHMVSFVFGGGSRPITDCGPLQGIWINPQPPPVKQRQTGEGAGLCFRTMKSPLSKTALTLQYSHWWWAEPSMSPTCD